MQKPFVSIILPTFNRAHYIGRAVESVLSQTYQDWELILIDDGSTDNTTDILASYSDKRIRYLFKENQGVSSARNVGIAESNGEMIALLDSDDEWLPNKLECQIKYMDEFGYNISQTNEIWMRKGKRVNQPAKYAKPEGWFFEESLEMCLISPSCTMFTCSVWDVVGPFDVSMPSCEDYDLWLRVCHQYPVGLVKDNLTIKYGGRPDQLSNCVPCADLYRLKALMKIIQSGGLTDFQSQSALKELQRKVEIYKQGCEKRGKNEAAEQVWTLFCKIRDGKEVPLDSFI